MVALLFKLIKFFTIIIILINSTSFTKLPLPTLVPIRYDIQFQLPTASDKDPLVPTFVGTAKLEFQLTRKLLPSFDESRQFNEHQEDEPLRLTFLSQKLEQFENVTLIKSGEDEDTAYKVEVELRPPWEVDFIVHEEQKEGGGGKLSAGRYILNIERFEGIITYNKGLFYRDAGGLPLLGSNYFFEFSPSLFPQLGGPLQKTTTKISLIHPHGTTALSSMHSLGPTESLNEHWRITRFVQAPNIAAYLLSIAVLPDSVYERTLIKTEPPLFLWTNRLLHTPILKKELAKISTPVFEAISSLLGHERLPLNALNLLIIDDFNNSDSTHSFGLLFISLIQWEASDSANKIALLARQFARQWLGGMTTVANTGIFCLQEDIVEWLTHKVVQRVLPSLLSISSVSDKAWQRFQLAHYLRINLAETFLAPGESVALAEWAGVEEIKSHCSLKGVQFFTSIEKLIGSKGEATLLGIIRRLLIQQRYRHFRLEHLDELLRPLLVDSIDIGQVFTFWFKSGGIPNLLIEKSFLKENKNTNRLRLVQLNNDRQAQQLLNGVQHWAKMPLWPIPINIQNVTLPFKFMLSQVLELAPLDRKLLPLTNLGFDHLYRVNYDLKSWERIVHELGDASTLAALNAVSRAQLLGDFCYFNAFEDNDEKPTESDKLLIERLQRNFLELLREHYEYFELCEFYAFWCMAGKGRRIPMDRESRALYLTIIQQNVLPALLNGGNYECGGPGKGFDAGNVLCRAAFGQNCFF